MIDSNYISTLPEASGNLTAGAYKVTILLCGTQVIYDNGLAIGGYKWKNK